MRGVWVFAKVLVLSALLVSLIGQVSPDERSLRVGKVTRTYSVHFPAHRKPGPLPAVIALHGRGLTAEHFRYLSGLDQVADREGFLVIYPQATGQPSEWYADWNVGDLHGCPEALQDADVGFLTALVDHVSRQEGVDPRRVYLCGYSNGAVMAARMAAAVADRIAAVGMVAGTVGNRPWRRAITSPRPAENLPLLQIHGRLDTSMPYDGGGRRRLLSVRDTVRFWKSANGLSGTRATSAVQGDGWRRETWGTPGTRQEIVLITLPQHGHGWPLRNAQHPDTPVDAATELWSFFRRHAR